MAAEPVSVGLSGIYWAYLATSSEANSPTMTDYLEFEVSGSATMDNGLTFGVSAAIGAAGGLSTYQRELSIGGAFGDVIIGHTRNARGKMRISSPSATAGAGVQDPVFGSPGDTKAVVATANSRIDHRVPRVVYMAPSVGGIQLGLSYAPDGAMTAAAGGGDVENEVSVAATFSQDLGVGEVSLNVGFETASPAAGGDSVDTLNAGGSLAVGDIMVSGGMRDDSNDDMYMDVGASLAMGALSVSAQWANSDNSRGSTNMYALGAGYPLGEGVQLNAQVDFGDHPPAGATDDGEWVQFMIGTTISF